MAEAREGKGAGGGRKGRPNCFECAHFIVTWERDRPRGCKAFGFKGREMPCDVVYANSGQECALFTPKRAGA